MNEIMYRRVSYVVIFLFVLFFILAFTNVLCRPLDLCFKSELGATCYNAKRRTGNITADLINKST